MRVEKRFLAKIMVLITTIVGFSAFSSNAQPAIPKIGDAPCAPEPTGAALNDSVVSSPDDSGYYNLFDGTFKGWVNSCATSHSSGSSTGAIWRIGADSGKPAIYSTQRDGQIGGVLMTKKKFGNYEVVLDLWPDFGNDGGFFNRTTFDGKCFQTVIDYLGDGALGGTWGEANYAGRDIRPFKFGGDEGSISIPSNDDGWTSITSKLDPTSYGCAVTGCVEADWRRLWDPNGWNELKIQFYGGTATNTGNIHMKSWFRRSHATTPWVPILQDTTLSQLTPPGFLGLQVHGGNRFNGAKGNWYRSIKWRPMTDKGVVIVNKGTSAIEVAKANLFSSKDINASSNLLSGKLSTNFVITIQDLNGKILESFSGKAGTFSHAFATKNHGWLNLQVKTSQGTQSLLVLRAP